ncbi:sulfite exporter TauE/SafE family protein [Pseudactinotalea suaedae]|uniref:sulfite exporter TauE/SafE family protein n=1 Tax=Pseudactinotalea suaedae TaxID=1524924 RepID=UPI0012E28EF7|nr:sulfite exporter TauE/SafE family protein [Pseudactinotalea suaedae]
MSLLALVLLGVIIALGAGLQRLSGMGFALVASPFLVLTVGPFEAVLITNVCGVISSLMNLTLMRRDVQWRRVLRFTPFALIGIGLGALVVAALPADPLAVTIGVTVLVAIGVTVLMPTRRLHDSLPISAGFGAASGFMNVTAGVGGPAMAVYAVATQWQHRHFAASAQVHFAVISLTSLLARRALPSIDTAGWLVTIAAILVGTFVGQRLAGRFAEATMMRVVIVLATAGALTTIVQAIL